MFSAAKNNCTVNCPGFPRLEHLKDVMWDQEQQTVNIQTSLEKKYQIGSISLKC